MLFDQDKLQLQLLEVLSFEEGAVTMKTKARPFYALSLRWDGDTEIVLPHGKHMKLCKRDLALFHPNLSYMRYSHNDCKIVFHFSLLNQSPYTEQEPEIEVLHDFRYDTLFPLFEEAYQIWKAQKPGYHIRCTALLYTIFAEIRENQQITKQSVSPLISAAVAYLDTHYSDPGMTVSSLAARLHISTTYLRSCFLKELHSTPKAYLCSMRMAHAQALLNTGYFSITNVAEQVGYRDSKNFATAYKKYFGYPPSAQRYDHYR